MKLTSAAFAEGSAIPRKYTCEGDEVSPPLAWTGAPERARTLAIVCEDPDAPMGTFTHWMVYNLPATVTELREDVPHSETFKVAGDGEALQGKNDFGHMGYGGPCPPSGTHHYHFELFALDTPLHLEAGASRSQLRTAMRGHVLAEGRLTGLFSRGK